MKVMIDAGHGGTASGAVMQPLVEKDLNLELAKIVIPALKIDGHDVYVTRYWDTRISNTDRTQVANKLDVDVYISLHHNATKFHNYDGLLILHYPRSSTGRRVAQSVATKFASRAGHIRNRGIRPGWYRGIPGKHITVLRKTKMPAIIIEAGSLDNDHDRIILLDEAARSIFYNTVARSIKEALNEVLIV